MSENGTVPCVVGVPDYEIIDGIMHISQGSWRMCMSLRDFKLGMARAGKVIAAYEQKRADVLPFRGHAARS